MSTDNYIVTTSSPEETREFGQKIAKACKGGEVFLLNGDLGAGKTCFTQGLAAGLQVKEAVTSPTFVLHCQYEGRLQLNHIDAYRLEDAVNVFDLGFEEYFGHEGCIAVIEWPEMIEDTLPEGAITVHIEATGEFTREFSLSADKNPGQDFIKSL